ncbi:MAG: aromatic ring-hydroxylating dioxygenase subunit alpha [Burkholderiales bacterium]
MTDAPARSQLKPSAPQLPVAAYCDPKVLERERQTIFAQGPGYVGHELMVPEVGDYLTLEWAKHGKALVRSKAGVKLLDNVCRHRQSLLLEGRGNAQNIVCPVHRWTYDLEGRLMGAPDFAQTPELPLRAAPLQSWHGLLFAGKRDVAKDLADFPLVEDYSFEGYVFDHIEVDPCPFNWKTFLEFFLELYHVEPFHPGLKKFVDAGNYQWGFGERWSYQTLGIKDGFRYQTSRNYQRYRDAYLKWSGGEMPKHGTVWSIYYPNVMLEWYPGSLVVSTVLPVSPGETINVLEFYYPEEVALFERELVEAHQAAYRESAAEDAAACVWLHKGRQALWSLGESDVGPYHSPHEDGMVHFHEWWRKETGFADV